MNRLIGIGAAAACAVLLAGCGGKAPEAGARLPDAQMREAPTPRADALAPFTTALRDLQPDDAFLAAYRTGDAHLVWLGAKHATRTDSLTFRLINDAYEAFAFDTVIVEGCPASWGPDPARLIDYARQGAAAEKDGFQQRGETVPAVMGALAQGASLVCGEPDDGDVKAFLLQQGYEAADLLGFYTLRSIPQWIREERIDNGADPRIDALLAEELATNRDRLDLNADLLPAVADWRAWRRATNGKPLGVDFSTEEAAPLADGPYGSNRIAAAISRARAVFLHELAISRAARGETVLVVFGASHLMIHRPALDAALGAPCAAGGPKGASQSDRQSDPQNNNAYGGAYAGCF